jgi:hypothetical protein
LNWVLGFHPAFPFFLKKSAPNHSSYLLIVSSLENKNHDFISIVCIHASSLGNAYLGQMQILEPS